MSVRQYIGARYVPRFSEVNGGVWSNVYAYEPLTIVKNGNDYYTSKQSVPVGVAITNTDYWVKTGDYNGAISSLDDRVTAAEGDIDDINTEFPKIKNALKYVSPLNYGAVLDGVTDDTNAIKAALEDGNVIFPKSSTVKLNSLIIPNNRIVDFNDSLVVTNGKAFAIGNIDDTVSWNYTQNIEVNNCIVKITAGQTAFDIANAIFCRFNNIRYSGNVNLPAGSTFFKVTNCFNLMFNNIKISGPTNSYETNAVAFVFDGDVTKGISGTNIFTNMYLSNILIQRVDKGIYFKNTDTARYDTFNIKNIGFSWCNYGLYMDANVDTSVLRMLVIDTYRAEMCTHGLFNRGFISISNPYLYENDYAIINHGAIVIYGHINISGNSTVAIESDNYIDFSNCICSLPNTYTYTLTGICHNNESENAITVSQNGNLYQLTQRHEPIDYIANVTAAEIFYSDMAAPLTPTKRIKIKHANAITVYTATGKYYTVGANEYLEFWYDGTGWKILTTGVYHG